MSDTVDKPQAITELRILRSCFYRLFLFSVEIEQETCTGQKEREREATEREPGSRLQM